MDIRLKRSKNIIALIICFCVAIISFRFSEISFYSYDFSTSFYKSYHLERSIYTIGTNSVYSVVGDSASKKMLNYRSTAKAILNEYRSAYVFVVDNTNKRTYSNTKSNDLNTFRKETEKYPYFMELNFKDNDTSLLIDDKNVNYTPKVYGSPVYNRKEDVTTYIAIPSIEKIKESKNLNVSDGIYTAYNDYVDSTIKTIFFIGSKILAAVVIIISLLTYFLNIKKKNINLLNNNSNVKSKNTRLLSIESLLLIVILLFLTIIKHRYNYLFIPLYTLLLFEIYYLINLIIESKSREDIYSRSIILKRLCKKDIKIDDKIILIKGSILLVLFMLTQLIIVCFAYSLDIDYYQFQIMPHFALDWIGGHGKFLSALIGMIICNLIIGMFIIKRLNKVVDIQHGVSELKRGKLDYKIEVVDNDMFKELATEINGLGEVINIAVEYRLKSERMKTDLITNVSHDLKTPLTAIINYISLMKKEDIHPEHVKDYVTVLDKRSQRLKVLIDDLFEVSKVSSNDIEMNLEENDINQLLMQSIVELEESIEESKLDFIINTPQEEVYILADGRKTFRVFENLILNILKYSLEGTRVYIDLVYKEGRACIILKNISKYPLNFDADEITERFTRGDLSRNTEGSGLGLAIAKGFAEAQGGNMKIDILGDMFIVTIEFDLI
ncbi:sensor histidine kinase [Romboutsia weinsteinii]|uniref:histidine kinase n=1 Tax=Romboutsia weinsteinii TaxID=2020949 RepID=A0A371IZ52_9FIRM|nr:HAMP domain-containing sensor histidine kinase [Romboutsia weinsteinii]RDY25763.1 sensor histidine kinase [Romboutsia weinsteinii]